LGGSCCGLSVCKVPDLELHGVCCIEVGNQCDSNDDCCTGNCDGGICQRA
jgi:hypothetical protein